VNPSHGRSSSAYEQHAEQDVRLTQRQLVGVELRHEEHGEPEQHLLGPTTLGERAHGPADEGGQQAG
jgi:hypothetical protein